MKSKGITLIALIITIIILLILSGMSINLLMGENGILSKAKTAKESTDKSNQEENDKLGKINEIIDNYTTRGINYSGLEIKYFNLSSDISISNNSEFNKIFDFTNLDTGTYLINLSIYSNAIPNSNVFGYLSTNEIKSAQSRYYFTGYSGYTTSSGYLVIEHNKDEENKFFINNYSGSTIVVNANGSSAVAIKIK
ncbi:hypothetical protein D3C72_1700760 [compost metagenome]